MNSKWHQLLASQAGKTWSLLRCRGSIVEDRLGPPFLCSVFAWITVLLLFTSPRVSANQPNIIIFLADDLGYADVGFNGCREILTTHIDTIAVNGVKFTDGYANHPVCSPSRARLLSGRYQYSLAFENNSGPIDAPFFLFFSFNAVHSPLETTKDYESRFPYIKNKKCKAYAGMLPALSRNGNGVITRREANAVIQRANSTQSRGGVQSSASIDHCLALPREIA